MEKRPSIHVSVERTIYIIRNVHVKELPPFMEI